MPRTQERATQYYYHPENSPKPHPEKVEGKDRDYSGQSQEALDSIDAALKSAETETSLKDLGKKACQAAVNAQRTVESIDASYRYPGAV